jgi:hypothetical protein
MSLDARYILVYDNLDYLEPTPMERDKKFLEDNFGGEVEFMECCTLFWDKPKYILSQEDIDSLQADQVLERRDGELWDIVK